LNAWNREVLRNLITEIDLALEALEAFFQAALVGAEVNP
jgi:hypothetical protein